MKQDVTCHQLSRLHRRGDAVNVSPSKDSFGDVPVVSRRHATVCFPQQLTLENSRRIVLLGQQKTITVLHQMHRGAVAPPPCTGQRRSVNTVSTDPTEQLRGGGGVQLEVFPVRPKDIQNLHLEVLWEDTLLTTKREWADQRQYETMAWNGVMGMTWRTSRLVEHTQKATCILLIVESRYIFYRILLLLEHSPVFTSRLTVEC